MDTNDVGLEAGGQRDGAIQHALRFIIRNEFFRMDGSLAARVTSCGGWLDHLARKLVVPPESLQGAMRLVSRTDDFAVLPSLKVAG